MSDISIKPTDEQRKQRNLTLQPTLTIPKLNRGVVTRYERMKQLAEEESNLKARVRCLETERKALAAEIDEAFDGRDQMRISAKRVLLRNLIVVAPQVIERAGYSYVQWKECAG